MWEYIIKSILKKDIRENSDIHQTQSTSYVESYSETKVKKDKQETQQNKIENNKFSTKSKRILNCPICKIPMEVKIFPTTNIEIDVCPECKGIFLDKGELKEIMGFELELFRRDNKEFLIYTPFGKK